MDAIWIPDSNDPTSDGESAVVSPRQDDNLANIKYLSKWIVNWVVEGWSAAVIAYSNH